MPTSVLEQIAAAVKTKLDELVASGVASLVERPLRPGVPTSPRDRAIYLYQDDPELDEEAPAGFTQWLQPFLAVCCVVPSDESTTPVDTAINEMRAQVEKKLLEDRTFGLPGACIDAQAGPPVGFSAAQGGFSGVIVTLIVKYRHREPDPYTYT